MNKLGFGIPSRASISSIKRDLSKDGIGSHVPKTNQQDKIWEGIVIRI